MSNKSFNLLALQQNILGKGLVFGQGFKEGIEIEPLLSRLHNLPMYMNGKHAFPFEFEGVETTYPPASMNHPNAMEGMPGAPGVLNYTLTEASGYYLCFVDLKLSESSCGPSEPAEDWLAAVEIEALPEELKCKDSGPYQVLKAMLWQPFDELFEFYDSYESISEFEFDDDLLGDMSERYFTEKFGARDADKIEQRDE